MTISSSTRTAGPFAGDGASVVFPFAFKIFQAADLVVTMQDDNLLTQVTLTLGVDYIVALNADQNVAPGGQLTMLAPLAVYKTLRMTSAVQVVQPASLTNHGGFYPTTIEDALDRLTIVAQQVQILVGHSLRVPEADAIVTLPDKAARSNKVLGFTPAGDPTMLVGVDASSATALDNLLQAIGGAGRVGFNPALPYGTGTVGAAIKAATAAAALQAESMTALRALPKTGAAVATLSSYYGTIDLAGAGTFRLDLTDTTSTDNGGTCIVATDGGRWKRVFVGDIHDKWFGAKVDGVTDDSAAVQAMLNSITNPKGQQARLCNGTRILNNLTIPAGVTLIGSGKETCTVYVTSTTQSAIKLGSYTRVQGVNFIYPNQVVAGTPTAYPPTITTVAGGAAYLNVTSCRFQGAYDAIVFGGATAGCSNVNIDDVDGFPLHYGIVIDSCVDILRLDRVTFNANLFGGLYAPTNTTLIWALNNGIGIYTQRCDSYVMQAPLLFGYKRGMVFAGGNPTGSANMGTVVGAIIDLCLAPIETINFQDGLTFIGGSMTSSVGLYGTTGGPLLLAGGAGVNTTIKFLGTIFRNYYDAVAACSTNVDFIDCEFYNYNLHQATNTPAINILAANITVKVQGGRIDGSGYSTSWGIADFTGYAGVTLLVSGVSFSGLGGYGIFKPGKTLGLGPCAGIGSVYYNGTVFTQNNQGSLVTSGTPTAGTWAVDDLVYIAGAATPKRCSVAGTPGTWV